MNKREFTRANTITQKKYGCKIKFIPIVHRCTYHHKNKKGRCINCKNTNYYVDGYYMILNNKIGWIVDNIK